jgi:hypothetical protein
VRPGAQTATNGAIPRVRATNGAIPRVRATNGAIPRVRATNGAIPRVRDDERRGPTRSRDAQRARAVVERRANVARLKPKIPKQIPSSPLDLLNTNTYIIA